MFISIDSDTFVNAKCIQSLKYDEEAGQCAIALRYKEEPNPHPDGSTFPQRSVVVKMTREEFNDIVLQLGCVK